MRRKFATAATAAALLAAGCGSSGPAKPSAPISLRLGFLTSITQAPALVGAYEGYFARDLGPGVKLQLIPFSTEDQEATALVTGQLDAAYVGPTSIIKALQGPRGAQIKVLSGAASGGAGQTVAPGIIKPTWPGGKFATAILVVAQKYLARHSTAVIGLVKGQIQANDYIHQDPAASKTAANSELALTGKNLSPAILTASFAQITFTNDPIAPSLAADAQHAVDAGLLKPVRDMPSLYDLAPLNELLRAAGEAQVKLPSS